MGGFVNALGGIGSEATQITRSRDKMRDLARQRLQDLQQAALFRSQMQNDELQRKINERKMTLEGKPYPNGQMQRGSDGKMYQQMYNPETGTITWVPAGFDTMSPMAESLKQFQDTLQSMGIPWDGKSPLTPEQEQAAEVMGVRMPRPINDDDRKIETLKKHLKVAHPDWTDKKIEDYAIGRVYPQFAGGQLGLYSSRPRVGSGRGAIDTNGMTAAQQRLFKAETSNIDNQIAQLERSKAQRDNRAEYYGSVLYDVAGAQQEAAAAAQLQQQIDNLQNMRSAIFARIMGATGQATQSVTPGSAISAPIPQPPGQPSPAGGGEGFENVQGQSFSVSQFRRNNPDAPESDVQWFIQQATANGMNVVP